ncbi:hypothetical protein [Luteimonas huabeiensis]|uniref:hypothetical protein n=1 Tax=Luteimonas huabeiensis TaxID=1244513 RepID=UPI0004640E7B|nr:hypothetical protein [Luteimonas huabeiensis]
MPRETLGALALALMLATLLAACTPTYTTDQERSKETPMPTAEDEATHSSGRTELLDPARQLYRYGSGICRELGKLPPPWRQFEHKRYEKPGRWGRFPPGYDWGATASVNTTELILEAEYSELGVSPANTLPGTVHRSGLAQDAALLALGRPLEEDAYRQMKTVQEALSGTNPEEFWPAPAPFPVSNSFEVYAASPKEYVSERSSLVIVSPALRAGVYCDPDYDWPNPKCLGLILLHDDEVGTISVNYEALGKLQEVVESMINAARAIRVDCPNSGEPS